MNPPINRDHQMKIRRRRWSDAPLLHAMKMHLDPPSAIGQSTFKSTDSPKDVPPWPLIAMRPLDQWLRLFLSIKPMFFANGSFALEFFRYSNCPDTKFECHSISLHSWCISASEEHLKSEFDREREEKSHLELQFRLRKCGMKSHASGD